MVAGVEENIELGQLVEDALQINSAGLDRHGIELRRQFEAAPPILVDKHKVLQILVNLISNAKYALSQARRADKLLTIRVGARGTDEVFVEVEDNGVGISPENINRIFAHGFTTRRNGHGFGLHSGALAAKDLGGALSVKSEGTDKGATFTLALPLRPAHATK
jgi:signal transduction histidine kinase